MLDVLLQRFSDANNIGKLVISERFLSLMIEIGTKCQTAEDEGYKCDGKQSNPFLRVVITGNRALKFWKLSFSTDNRIFFLFNLSGTRMIGSNQVFINSLRI